MTSIVPRTLRLATGLLLALVMERPAHAAQFDDYQLIMWQERTPAQIEGLKRLGFTATKLRATSGSVDPADLAAHIASGLPWYLENIATDLYATYHRYTPGKPVMWRFNEAKDHRRADPTDTSVFVREPGLSDPIWLDRIAIRLRDLQREQARYRPLFYNLADEAGIGDLAAAWDADIAPSSLAAMRVWLRSQYPDLAALNAEWATSFAGWDDVVPELTDQALQRTDGNYAAWADFKAWMDVAFARALRVGTDALHAADPSALAGLEGAQLPGWGGYDYARLAHTVDVMEIYDTANSLALARAANPALITLRTSFGPGDGPDAWRAFLQGGRGIVVWDEGDAVVNADGSAAARGRELSSLVAEIRAIAPTILAGTPALDPVAILVSQASFRTQWLLDRRTVGAAWSDRDAGREYEDNAWRAGRREAMQRLLGLGLAPHLLHTPDVEAGALASNGIKVLMLPQAIALSDAEVAAIRAFAAAGGTVLADTEPGLFDGHSRRRDRAPLAGIAVTPEPLLRAGMSPDSGNFDAVAALLGAAGAAPRATFRAPDGNRAPGIEARWLAYDGAAILSLQAIAPYSAPPEISVDLGSVRTIRDLRHPGRVWRESRFQIVLDSAEPTILELRP